MRKHRGVGMLSLASWGVEQWLGVAGLVAAPLLTARLEGKPGTWPIGFSTFFLLFAFLHLLFPGTVVALWMTLMLTAIIGIASKLKYRYLGFNLLAGDLYHLAASSWRSVLVDHARMAIPALFAAAAIVAAAVLVDMTVVEEATPLSLRLVLFAAAVLIYIVVYRLSGGAPRFRFDLLTRNRAHLSAFVASWLGAGPSRRPGFVDITPDPLPLLPPVPAKRGNGEARPHIFMILQESTFDPRHHGVPIDRSFEQFFSPANGLSGALHVDVFGGSTLQTEFSVLTGLSSLSFGNDSRFVFHLLAGRVRHSLPSVLSGMGYHVSHVSCDRPNFVNCDRFYKSVGFEEVTYAPTLPPPFDLERWRRERHDEQLYNHALGRIADRLESEKPCFLSIMTLMNHGDHRRRIFPPALQADVRREAVALTGDENYGEYAVRLAESVEAYAAFREKLKTALKGRPAIIVRYGDHQPSFTTASPACRLPTGLCTRPSTRSRWSTARCPAI
ncbi:hypothetical protein MJ8_34780 [Mesorhizobium sp. J8]|nr:hypothetical protein MJ8_34780 [Mesorhizobium sp. J8]